jgi:hypothetical protein
MPEKLKQPHGKRATKNPNGWLKNNNPPCDIRSLPKCKARSKSTGVRCGNVAMKGKRVCHIHGGRSPGPPRGNQNSFKHGRYAASSSKADLGLARELLNKLRTAISRLKECGDVHKKGTLPSQPPKKGDNDNGKVTTPRTRKSHFKSRRNRAG